MQKKLKSPLSMDIQMEEPSYSYDQVETYKSGRKRHFRRCAIEIDKCFDVSPQF